MQIARGEILVFTDADVILDFDALRQLVQSFADPRVGVVAGDFTYLRGSVFSIAERLYWKINSFWKMLQSRGGDVTSAAGTLYGIRSELYRPIPERVVDDFFESVQVVRSGHRLVFDPLVRCRSAPASLAGLEYQRKVRIISRGLHAVWLLRDVCNPFRYGFYAVQVLTHKLLRRLSFLFFFSILAVLPFLAPLSTLYQILWIGELVFLISAGTGFVFRHHKGVWGKVFLLPFYILMINVAAFHGVILFVFNRLPNYWLPPRKD